MRLKIALGSLLVAIILGLIGVAAKLSPHRFVAWWGDAYSTLIRGVSDRVLLLLFFGGQIAVNEAITCFNDWMIERGTDLALDFIDVDPFLAGVLTTGFIFRAYLSETFRGRFWPCPWGNRKRIWSMAWAG
ncbi:ABC-type arginine transport system permease subunit [Chitinivorax tropicus]|uniref:ABC-type arginine transport system permease subunit n=1 Tax=Chitinivorax tropicus TaxID=714531 RepID=A0A840MF28_9PROT|nr:hypothetical protein [Chitinivorax tropicus]MBB5017000.1 ABC-type arginine transport system permease subunit [Chitinivorax tropicus]